jgi:hypothetical protein
MRWVVVGKRKHQTKLRREGKVDHQGKPTKPLQYPCCLCGTLYRIKNMTKY